ncbi:MAG: serine protease, partial [Methylococcales bacterium]
MSELIVRVFAKNPNPEKKDVFLGTAFLINDQFLLTARHVIERYRDGFKDDKQLLYLTNGPFNGHVYLNEIIPHDNDAIDVALLRLRLSNSKPTNYLPLAQVKGLKGKKVTIPGFKNTENDSSDFEHSISSEMSEYHTLALQNKDQHGKSGSPVILNNEIVGIFYARSDHPNPLKDVNETYIHPYEVFKEFVESQVEYKIRLKNSHESHRSLDFKSLDPDMQVALVDREDQWHKHIEVQIRNETKKLFTFVVAGVKEEWPESILFRFRMHYGLKREKQINLAHQAGSFQDWEDHFWAILLEHITSVRIEEITTREQLVDELINSNTPSLYYWFLGKEASSDLDFIHAVIHNWEALDLSNAKRQHCLLIVYGIKEKGRSLIPFIGKRSDHLVESWRLNIATKLAASNRLKIVTSKLKTPDKE